MHIAILTFEGFNELDSLIAFGILNRVKKPDWRVSIACPAARVTSMNGVVLASQVSLAEAVRADAVLVGSGAIIARLEGIEAARDAMHYVAPVGEKEEYVERMLRNVVPCLDTAG